MEESRSHRLTVKAWDQDSGNIPLGLSRRSHDYREQKPRARLPEENWLERKNPDSTKSSCRRKRNPHTWRFRAGRPTLDNDNRQHELQDRDFEPLPVWQV